MIAKFSTTGPGALLLALFLFINTLRGERKEWTILIYIAGDNSLTESADIDLLELERGVYCDKINTIIEIDRAYPSKETNTVVYIKNKDGLYKLKDLGELDTGDPDVLKNFILWGVSSFPAKRYGLILWGHGKSWNKNVDLPFKFFANDFSSGNSIDVYNGELRSAIPDSIFDFIIFDACMMGGIEVLSELTGKTKWIIASPSLVPVSGMPYDSLLAVFANNYAENTEKILIRITNVFLTSMENKQFPLSISLYKEEELLAFLSELRDYFKLLSTFQDSLLLSARLHSFGYSMVNPNVMDSLSPYIDFFNFMENVGINDITPDSVVYYHKATGIYSNTSGVHIWFPLNFSVLTKEFFNYKRLLFEKKTFWSDVIMATHIDSAFSYYPESVDIKKEDTYIKIKWVPLAKSENWLYSLIISEANDGEFNILTPSTQVKLNLFPGVYEVSVGLYNPVDGKLGRLSPPQSLFIGSEDLNIFPPIITEDMKYFLMNSFNIYDIAGRKIDKLDRTGFYIITKNRVTKKIFYIDKTK